MVSPFPPSEVFPSNDYRILSPNQYFPPDTRLSGEMLGMHKEPSGI